MIASIEDHDDDVVVLRALLATELGEDECAAFLDMLHQLELSPKLVLSEKQRGWARGRADDLQLQWWDPAKRNQNVPRGHDVRPAWDVNNLPKKPPSRRHG